MTWIVVAGVVWTALVLALGLHVGRVMARADRRAEAGRLPAAPTSTPATGGEGPRSTAPGAPPSELSSSPSTPSS